MSLADVFAQVRAENRAAFIAYYPAGYPTVDGSVDAIKAIVDAGADIVEVGLPYSDPMMDGPTIQEAANIALAEGFRIRDLFRVVREVTDAGGNCQLFEDMGRRTVHRVQHARLADRCIRPLQDVPPCGQNLRRYPLDARPMRTLIPAPFMLKTRFFSLTGVVDGSLKRRRVIQRRGLTKIDHRLR